MSSRQLIPYNKPYVSSLAFQYLSQSLRSSTHAGDGAYTKSCSDLLEKSIGVQKVLLTPSCTHALELAGLLFNFGPGDEVILPSYTFVSCANFITLRGATPVFCDSRVDNCNIDENQLEPLITPRTRGIVVVHYAGQGCEMEKITSLSNKYGVPIIEDLAHGPYATYKGRNLGTFGNVATLSFHQTKNFSTGEGGALLLNDPALIERAEIIREKGTNRAKFLRGEIDKYTWVDVGSSYLMADYQAALLQGGLEQRDEIQSWRQNIWRSYKTGLTAWADGNDVRLPSEHEESRHSAHIFYMIMPDVDIRQRFIEYMKSHSVQVTFHYQALNKAPMAVRCNYNLHACGIADSLSDTLVRLPIWYGLEQESVDYIIDNVLKFQF